MQNCDFNEVSLQTYAEHLFEEPQWGMLIFLNSLTNHRYQKPSMTLLLKLDILYLYTADTYNSDIYSATSQF